MKNFRILAVLSLLFAVHFVCSAQQWSSGSVALLYARGDYQMSTVGEVLEAHTVQEFPSYKSGLFKINSKDDCSVYVVGSNNLSLLFNGPGHCAVERFEQNVAALGGERQGRSRMILSLSKGRIILDNRKFGRQSSIMLETPLGRITGSGAYWSMKIAYDEGSQRYNFQIECAEGTLRFNDVAGQVYLLYSGQRLSGAGSSSSLSIEAAEFKNEERELFEEFEKILSLVGGIELSASEMQRRMQPLFREGQAADASDLPQTDSKPDQSGVKRPLIIEFEPAPPLVTPFRGEIRPFSELEADLF